MFAHGVGERGDLPLPLWMFVWSLGLALLISFIGLGVLWTQPTLVRASVGRRLASYRSVRPFHVFFKAIAFALYVLCLVAAVIGTDDQGQNITPVTIYVLFWVGAQLAGGLIGDAWQAVSPVATLASAGEWLGRKFGVLSAGPTAWGHWPATFGLLIFLFYELSHPFGTRPRTLAWILFLHAGLTFSAGVIWGAAWVKDHEPFTVFFAKIGAMAPIFSSDKNGRLGHQDQHADSDSIPNDSIPSDPAPSLRVRWPMTGLSTMPVRTGTVALILTAIGGTSFDGFSESELGRDVFGGSFLWTLAWQEAIGLIVSILLVALLYGIGTWWTSRVTTMPFGEAWREFAPSLVPIAFGYAVGHYFQLFSDESQSFFFRLSDPLGRGWNLLGFESTDIWTIGPTAVSWVQVLSILFGHIGAVVVSHDRALEVFPVGRSLQSQFGMLFVMVAYSTLGLWLLTSA